MPKKKKQETEDRSGDLQVLARAKEVVKKAFQSAHDNQNKKLDDFIRWYELYRNVQTKRNYEGRANLFVPEPYTIVEATHARVIRSFAGVRAKPQGPDDVEKAEQAETLLEWQTRVYNWKQAFKDMDKSAHIFGTGLLKVGWVYTEDGKRDHPVIEAIDPINYFFDPGATSRENMRFEIHRTERTIDELKRNPNYFNIDLLESQQANEQDDDSHEARKRSVIGMPNKPKPEKKGGKYEILEYWGLFAEEEGGEEKEWLITLANDEIVIRAEENPYSDIFIDLGVVEENMVRPFVLMKDTDIPFEVYGMGLIEPIESLVQELNDTRNQRMDNVTDVIDHMWQVVDAGDVDESELVRRPGGVIHVAVPNAVTPLPVGDVTASAYNEEQIIKQDIRNAIGLPEVATGSLDGAQGEAAATILSLQESANIRFDTKLSAFADAVRHAYSLVLAFNQAFLDKKVTARLESEEGFEFVELDKDAVRGKFDIDVQMDTQINKIVRRQEAFQLYQLLATNPMINQQVNTRLLLESVDRKEIEELMNIEPPPPPPPEGPKKSISVSLKGDLNALESDDLAVIMGASPESADPLLRPETRSLMMKIQNGEPLDEGDVEMDQKRLALKEKFIEEERLTKREEADSLIKAKELELKEMEIKLKGADANVSADKTLFGQVKEIFSRPRTTSQDDLDERKEKKEKGKNK